LPGRLHLSNQVAGFFMAKMIEFIVLWFILRTPNPEPRTPNPEPRTPNPEPLTTNRLVAYLPIFCIMSQ